MTDKSKEFEFDDFEEIIELAEEVEIFINGEAVSEKQQLAKKIEASISRLMKDKNELPEQLFLLPVKDRPFFPGQTLPIMLSKDLWEKTIRKVLKSKQNHIGIIFVTSDDQKKAKPKDFSKT